MLSYYLKLSCRNFIRQKTFFSLMVISLAVGVGVFMVNLTIINTMSNDPLPEKGDSVYQLSLNIWTGGEIGDDIIHIMRYDDAMHLLKNDIATYTTTHYSAAVYARQLNAKSKSRVLSRVRATTPDFFPLTNAPFAYGGAWSDDFAQQIVIGHSLNQQLFGGGDNVGKSLDIGDKAFEIVGILKPWKLKPKFYHASEGNAFNNTEDIFAPLDTAMDNEWSVNARYSATEAISTVSESRGRNGYYLQMFVQLDTPSQKDKFMQYVNDYTQNRAENGEHQSTSPNRLLNVTQWLEFNNVVNERMLAFAVASFLFLLVCIFNASSLLVSRYHASYFELSLRRAVGASKQDIIIQGLIESLLIGAVCAGLSLLCAWLFLTFSVNILPDLNQLTEITSSLIVMGVVISMIVSIVSVLYPLISSANLTLSSQLK